MNQNLLEGEGYVPARQHTHIKILLQSAGLIAAKDHVCSLLRRPQPLPWRGLAIGVLALLVFAVGTPVVAQQTEVSGRVVSANDETALGGVTVTVKNTGTRTMTDENGLYRITTDSDAILVFTSIGYQTTEEAIRGRTEINTFLEPAESALQEVEVNAGYYTVKDRERTGSISRITADDISKQPVSNPLQAMQGRMAGVQIQQLTGVPGGGFNIQIRGRNSLRNDGNAPLYVVDGVPFTASSLAQPGAGSSIIPQANPLNVINPADIKSIEVLKDADATSIYGSRGANGVVLITTKQHAGSGMAVDVNFQQGISRVASRMDLLNTQQYLEMRNEAYANDGQVPNGYAARDLLQWDTTRYTDWQQELVGGTANRTNAQLSIAGGTGQTRFLFGGGIYRESTVFPGDFAMKRITGRLSVSHASKDGRLRLNAQAGYQAGNNNLPKTTPMRDALTLPPNAPALYDSEGQLNWEDGSWQNPLAQLRVAYVNRSTNLNVSSMLAYDVLPGLTAKINAGYNTIRLDEEAHTPISSLNPTSANRTGSSFLAGGNETTWIAEPQLEYRWSKQRHELQVLAGGTFQESLRGDESLLAMGYTSDALLGNLTAATSLLQLGYQQREYRYAAFFSRVNYNFDGTYIINLTGRRDGSSRFGEDKRFASFGAVGAAWIFSNMEFLKEQSVLSFGKLRFSYGISGSDQIGDYGYLDTYTATTPYQGGAGLIPARLVNPDYAWETNRKLEGAIELAFFGGKIDLSAAYYRNRSSNQLVGYGLPGITGFSTVQANLPAVVQNTGWEMELYTRNIQNGSFSWHTSINLSVPRNKLVAYPNLEGSSYANTYEVGQSLHARKVRQLTGIDPQTGVFTFADLDNDGVAGQSPGDLYAAAAITPSLFSGLGNRFTYKRFSLDIFFQFVKQQGYNPYYGGFSTPGYFGNKPAVVMDRWRPGYDQPGMQRFTQSVTPAVFAWSNAVNSDLVISDASFVRLSNVAVAWQLPMAWGAGTVERCSLYLQGQNLFTLSGYWGTDPETQSAEALPPLTTVIAGIQLTL